MKLVGNLLLFLCYVRILSFSIFMFRDFVFLLLLLLLLFLLFLLLCMDGDVLWPGGISIGRLTRFIIPIHLSIVCTIFFILFFCFLLFTSLRLCKSMCVSEWVSMHRGMEANAHTYRDNIKRKRDTEERTSSIHSYTYSLLVLFSLISSVRMMVVIFFFWSRIRIEGKKSWRKKCSCHLHFTRAWLHARSFASL